MKEEDKLKVVKLLMLLQVCVYATDDTLHIPWFNKFKTKNVLNTFVNIILKEHGDIIHAFWNVEELDIVAMTKVVEEFAAATGSLEFYDLEDVTKLINQYKQSKKQ